LRRVKKRHWFLLLIILLAPVAVVAFRAWREAGMRGGQKFAEPFRIAGNLYYVGANDVTSFLITGPQGHVLIDGGYPRTAPMIMSSIKRLGFDIRDVKVLLNSEPHFDHAGGLGEIQKASGAKLYVSDVSADVIEAGGDDRNAILPIRMLAWSGISRYPAVRAERRLKDGDTIRLGPIEIVARITPGHTRGCTSFDFPVRDGDRELRVVFACSLIAMGVSSYPAQKGDFERSFAVLRSIPADIWVSAHARQWGRYRKFLERAKAKDPVDPFIDREGYRGYIDSAEARFKRGVRG
jgi:metallo-beta-lactamase class B